MSEHLCNTCQRAVGRDGDCPFAGRVKRGKVTDCPLYKEVKP